MDSTPILEKIGLSAEQAKLYQTLLQHGPLSLFELAKRADLHRPKVYQILPSLLEMGILSTQMRGKRKIYRAENPELLEALFEKTKSDFGNALTSLKKLYTRDTNKPFLKTIEGSRFSLAIFDDMLGNLGEGEVHYRYSSRPEMQDDESYKLRRKK